VRLRQQRLLVRRLRGLADDSAAMPVGRGDEARGYVVAEKGDGGGVGAVGDRQRPAVVAAVLRVAERRIGAEADARQIDGILRAEAGNCLH
jgi:hypothetical protein